VCGGAAAGAQRLFGGRRRGHGSPRVFGLQLHSGIRQPRARPGRARKFRPPGRGPNSAAPRRRQGSRPYVGVIVNRASSSRRPRPASRPQVARTQASGSAASRPSSSPSAPGTTAWTASARTAATRNRVDGPGWVVQRGAPAAVPAAQGFELKLRVPVSNSPRSILGAGVSPRQPAGQGAADVGGREGASPMRRAKSSPFLERQRDAAWSQGPGERAGVGAGCRRISRAAASARSRSSD